MQSNERDILGAGSLSYKTLACHLSKRNKKSYSSSFIRLSTTKQAFLLSAVTLFEKQTAVDENCSLTQPLRLQTI